MNESPSVFQRLMTVIEDRKRNPPEKSYTNTLLRGGAATIGQKLMEEAAEVIEAACEPVGVSRKQLTHECADVIYHLFVLLALHDITLVEVEAELERRFGVSGLDEKTSRTRT